ncbi:MAG TPA: tRNA (N6-isopentenyl adenosine(37)-C2)-methylthiotransferase MiaB, partial [Thermoanaerobaculia bacterium]|nr:tRNA (N6-isopentenyl adenosine(37)-C2)-methylthiotransferase MiaB [Thermoanaerobaculia bacterium]
MTDSAIRPLISSGEKVYRDLPKQQFFVETWGCQMNVLDGQRMAGILEAGGLEASSQETADVILLNTCSVRDKADAKVYSALGVLGQRKRERPDLVIGVAGCLAQVKGDEILERAP